MNIKKKKFFPITPSVWKRSTVAILCMFCLVLQVNAQNDRYHPLVQEGRTWSVLERYGQMPWEWKFTTTQMAFFGDTIISDIPYKKMYVTTKEFPQFPQDWTLQNFMREDENKKVWYKMINSGMEELYYDFSLEIGDTLPENLGRTTHIETVIVEDITYKTIQNGEVHKVWHLSYISGYKESWIEGIGSTIGVLEPVTADLVGLYNELLCVHENEELIYNENTLQGICYKSGSTGIKDYDKNQIYIYPNPTKNELVIDNGQLRIDSVELFDVLGRKLQFKIVNLQSEIVIDISEITDGIYFIKIASSKGEIIKKVLINK